MTLDEIVSDYIRLYRAHARAEMSLFVDQSSASLAIGKATFCALPNGKRHPHQYRVPKAVLEQAEGRLQAASKRLSAASDFGALHDIVEREIGGIRGIGALTVYDIAHRLGAFFGKAPLRVYLHAGTREGAAILGLGGGSIDPNQLPDAFDRLAAAEIEDCLCIYKAELRGAQRTPTPSTSTQSRTTLASICPVLDKPERLRSSSRCGGRARRRAIVC